MIVSRTSTVVLAAVVAASVASSASAAFTVPNGVNYAWTRGVTNNSAYAEWNNFTSALNGANTPDVGSSVNGTFDATAPAWNVTDSAAGAVVTGSPSGNIYAGFSIFTGTVSISSFGLGSSYTTTVLVQLSTLAIPVAPQSATLNGFAPTSITVLSSTPTVGFPGSDNETLYRFDVPGNDAGYAFNFLASDQHLSLDRVAVDIFAAPAPGAASLLGMGGLIAARRRRSR